MSYSTTLPSGTASCVLAIVASMPGLPGDIHRQMSDRFAGGAIAYAAKVKHEPEVQRAMSIRYPAPVPEPANDVAQPEPAHEPVTRKPAAAPKQPAAVDPGEAARRQIAQTRGRLAALPETQFGGGSALQPVVQPPRAAESPATSPAPERKKGGAKNPTVQAKMDAESAELLKYICEDFVLLTTKGGLYAYHIESGDELNKEAFIAYCAKHYGGVVYITVDAEGKEAATQADSGMVWWGIDHHMRRTVRRIVMEPTRHGVEDDPCGADVFNRWHFLKTTMAPVNPSATLADVNIFLSHLMYLSDGDEAVVMYFMNWLATLYQFPDVKIPSAILMYSKSGRIGKSMIYELLKRVFGAPLCASADGASIQSKFMDGLEHKRLMYLNEMARSDKQDGYERFKTLVSEPEQMFEGKGRAARVIKNITHFIITTNNEDALPLMENDGRIAVFRCLAERRANDYYATLDAWLKGPGPGALAQVLSTWKFPVGWNAMAPVPQTEAARAMQKLNQGDLRPIVEELIENHTAPFDRDFGQPAALVTQLAVMYPTVKVNGTSIGKVFKALGLAADTQYRTERHGRLRLCIWRNVEQWSKWARTPEERSAHIEKGVRPFVEGEQA